MANKFEEMKVEMPKIYGSTTINHYSRTNLGLNCSEYVLMEYVYRCVRDKKGMDIQDVYLHTGFTEAEQGMLLKALTVKGFIFPEIVNPPNISDKWIAEFMGVEREFEEEFWRKNGKVVFNGSKKKALHYYELLRKKYAKTFVMAQKDAYLDYLSMEHKRGFDRAVMAAERWLSPHNEYYLNDWKKMADEIRIKLNKGIIKPSEILEKHTKTETLTEEQRQKAYEQDSNQ